MEARVERGEAVKHRARRERERPEPHKLQRLRSLMLPARLNKSFGQPTSLEGETDSVEALPDAITVLLRFALGAAADLGDVLLDLFAECAKPFGQFVVRQVSEIVVVVFASVTHPCTLTRCRAIFQLRQFVGRRRVAAISTDNVLSHRAVNVGQAEIAARIAIRQALVIDPQ